VAWDGREHPEWLTGTSPLHLHLYDTIAAVLDERSRITQLMINFVLVHVVDMCVDGPWTHYRNIIGRPQCSEAFLEHYGRIWARSLSTDYIKQIRFKAGRHCNTQQVNKLPNRLVSTRVRLPRLGIQRYSTSIIRRLPRRVSRTTRRRHQTPLITTSSLTLQLLTRVHNFLSGIEP